MALCNRLFVNDVNTVVYTIVMKIYLSHISSLRQEGKTHGKDDEDMFGYKKVKVSPEEVPGTPASEFHKAMQDLAVAEYNFQNALPEYFEAANAELTAARERVNAFTAWTKE